MVIYIFFLYLARCKELRSWPLLTLLRLRRWEDYHKSPESSAAMPIGLQSPIHVWPFLLLFSHRTKVVLLPFKSENKEVLEEKAKQLRLVGRGKRPNKARQISEEEEEIL